MIGVALALIVIGLIGLFVFPWGGIVLGVVGVILLIAYLAGFERRAAEGKP